MHEQIELPATGPDRPGRLSRAERIGLASLALAPAIVIPGALNRFVFGKLALASVGILCALFAPARGRLPRSAWLLLTAAGLLLLIAALRGADPTAQLVGLPPRYEGAITLPIYLGAVAAGARLLGPDRASGSTAWFLDWLSFAALAIGAVAALEAVGIEILPGTGARAGSLLGNASDEGVWAVLCLGPLGALALTARQRLHRVGAGAAAVTLLCSESRGALVGLLALAVTLFALIPTRRTAIVTLLAMIAVAAFALPATRERILGLSPLADKTAKGRVMLLQETTGLIESQQLFGSGPSSFVDRIPLRHTIEYERVIGPSNPPDSPHNWILQALVAGGVGLALITLALATLTLHAGWQGLTNQPTDGEAVAYAGLLAGLVGYAVALLFHFTSPGTTPLAGALAGALLSSRPGLAPAVLSGASRAIRVASMAVLGVLLVLLVLAGLAEIQLRRAVSMAAEGRLQAAQQEFAKAEALRPWDAEVPSLATHAFAVLAANGVPRADAFGSGWSTKAIDDDPDSIRTLLDAAALAQAAHQRRHAIDLITQALSREPDNPALAARRRELLR